MQHMHAVGRLLVTHSPALSWETAIPRHHPSFAEIIKNKKHPASRYKFFVTCSRACSITTESTLCKHSVPPCVGRVPREPCRGRRARRLIRVDPRSVQGAGFDSAGFLVRRCSLTAAPRLWQERMAYMQPAPQQAPARQQTHATPERLFAAHTSGSTYEHTDPRRAPDRSSTCSWHQGERTTTRTSRHRPRPRWS